MSIDKKNIRAFSLPELQTLFIEKGESKFRAKQVYEWLWKKQAKDFEEMSNLSKEIRQWLNDHYVINPVTIDKHQISNDRTIKNAFKLHDGYFVEGVLIPTDSRMTACISSQVGCSLSCKFCATGKLERMRNLDYYEIFDQVALIKEQSESHYNIPLSNIVYMGMGEPLLNYNNVMKSIEMITSNDGLGMSPNRITVSTAGISKMIKKLADDGARFNLALSLHAASDEKRNEIMPINESNTLETLEEALIYFYEKTGTRPTLEYIMFDHFNDTLKDAELLAKFARKLPTKINLIEYNSIGDGLFQKSKEDRLNAFFKYLAERKFIVNLRRSRGKDIDAACGQLANKSS